MCVHLIKNKSTTVRVVPQAYSRILVKLQVIASDLFSSTCRVTLSIDTYSGERAGAVTDRRRSMQGWFVNGTIWQQILETGGLRHVAEVALLAHSRHVILVILCKILELLG